MTTTEVSLGLTIHKITLLNDPIEVPSDGAYREFVASPRSTVILEGEIDLPFVVEVDYPTGRGEEALGAAIRVAAAAWTVTNDPRCTSFHDDGATRRIRLRT